MQHELTSDCRRWLAGRLNVERAMAQIMGGDAVPDSEERQVVEESQEQALSDDMGDQTVVAQGLPLDGVRASGDSPANGHGVSPAVEPAPEVKPSRLNEPSFERTVRPSHGNGSECSCGGGKTCTCGAAKSAPPTQLVFALGQLGFDFGTEARRDSIAQHMKQPANPHDPRQLLAYLDENPWDAAEIIWTLTLDQTPIYAITALGPFASQISERLGQFLKEQLTEGVERISVPGTIVGSARLFTGQVVPVIHPALRGMYSWTIAALLKAVGGRPQGARGNAAGKKEEAVRNFLLRIYHELRNLGLTPQQRAINYSATNALLVSQIFEQAIKDEMELDSIETERSPICRPDSDCWDVKLTFFDPQKVFERARMVFRFTVDVSDVVPVMVGEVRSWSVR